METRLNPCPSCRDAFSLSMFNPCARADHFVQNAPWQAPKPILFSNLYGPTKQDAENAGFEMKAAPQRLKAGFITQQLCTA
jgi:hypothetical protein